MQGGGGPSSRDHLLVAPLLLTQWSVRAATPRTAAVPLLRDPTSTSRASLSRVLSRCTSYPGRTSAARTSQSHSCRLLSSFATSPPPAKPDSSLVQPTALVIMTHNWGGITLQTALARLWVEDLQPHVLCWHELWDQGVARLAIPTSYESIWSTATGPGTGFVIAWRRALRRRPEEATLAYDGDHCLGALLPLWHVGRLLVCNIHLHPKIPYREWIRQLRHMDQLRKDLRPDFSYITGDFNSTDAPGTPPAEASRPGGTLHGDLRVIPPGTTTNHTVVQGRPRSPAIDHSFLHGPVASAQYQLLPSRSSHAVIVVTITLHTQSADAWG